MAPGPQRLRELVKERLALDLSRREDAWFEQLLDELAKEQGLPNPGAVLERLQQEPLSGSAWTAIVDRLTIAETYFFRDTGQMELLRDTLLPQLMREAQGRRLRVWSAGCSSGEELYSLAILLEGLGSPAADLIGSDVNPAVIEQARLGIYRERSLRNLPPGLRSVYLQPHGREYQVSARLRDRTRFMVENLLEEQSAQLMGLDLIVCRNVLIYFDRDLLPKILERFFKALRPGGLLLTGHGELLTVDTPFETLAYPSSLVYRRPDLPGSRQFQVTPAAPAARPAKSPPEPGPVPVPEPSSAPPTGPVKEPLALCRQARAERLAGRRTLAHTLLRQALYLDPNVAGAYLELGLLSASTDPDKARRHRGTALALLSADLTPPSPETVLALQELEQVLA